MADFVDAFDSITFATPTGIFTAGDEGVDFEYVPTSLMEQVNAFLNEVMEELRCSMAKDMVNIKNESLATGDNNSKNMGNGEMVLGFQKKIILLKHGVGLISELEKEDELLNPELQSRSMDKMRASQQDCIIVSSLIDRIPNLAGLPRTCEVFKAPGLVVGDARIVKGKQFQLISVSREVDGDSSVVNSTHHNGVTCDILARRRARWCRFFEVHVSKELLEDFSLVGRDIIIF